MTKTTFIKLTLALCFFFTLGACADGPENTGASQQRVVTLEPLDSFVANANEGIHMVAADGTILAANPKDYEPLGYAEEDYVGLPIQEFHLSQPPIVAMLAILLGGGELVNYPARLRRHDGSTAYVLIRSSLSAEYGHTRCFTSEVSQVLFTVRAFEMGIWEP